ncbi:MAG: hypothetical protein IT385_22605 [Deltaproteobacteria bacterium]|nr:hypothetical protein [Deltaproteobacteria bacterium]
MSFADPTEGPSIAAIVTPWTPQTALAELGIALGKDGYVPRAEPLPQGYRPHAGELVQAQAFGIARSGLCAIVPVEVGRVFHVARILSAHAATDVLVGWRRMSGFYPTAKVFWAGRPQWKDGEDPDHEVDYHVPKSQPAELRWPGPARVPLTASELTELLLPIVTPIKSVWTSKPIAPGALFGAWLLRSSALA